MRNADRDVFVEPFGGLDELLFVWRPTTVKGVSLFKKNVYFQNLDGVHSISSKILEKSRKIRKKPKKGVFDPKI